jgi:hypothetical protein
MFIKADKIDGVTLITLMTLANKYEPNENGEFELRMVDADDMFMIVNTMLHMQHSILRLKYADRYEKWDGASHEMKKKIIEEQGPLTSLVMQAMGWKWEKVDSMVKNASEATDTLQEFLQDKAEEFEKKFRKTEGQEEE